MTRPGGVKASDGFDDKDLRIIMAMREDSRTPMGEIGQTLGISKATVSRRVAKLEERGIIRGYCLDVDSSKLGVLKSIVSMQIVGSPVSHVIEQLVTYDEIGTIYKSFGDHNIVCEVYTVNVDALYDMIQTKLLKMPSVRNVEVDILVERMVVHRNADIAIYEGAQGKEG
ncbi:MAG: Lrp/AsnC family transcriptional regulator [Thermoplasmatales archaeon]|nr:Lrp/AsnC family transcriptional regulator [Thermoplasmatales archaeon]